MIRWTSGVISKAVHSGRMHDLVQGKGRARGVDGNHRCSKEWARRPSRCVIAQRYLALEGRCGGQRTAVHRHERLATVLVECPRIGFGRKCHMPQRHGQGRACHGGHWFGPALFPCFAVSIQAHPFQGGIMGGGGLAAPTKFSLAVSWAARGRSIDLPTVKAKSFFKLYQSSFSNVDFSRYYAAKRHKDRNLLLFNGLSHPPF